MFGENESVSMQMNALISVVNGIICVIDDI